MSSLTFQIVSWPMFGAALLVFGFAPGAALRLIVLLFSRDDPRRRELLGELYAVPRIERPFWVFEQLEVGLFEGLRGRFARRRPRDRGGAIQHAGEQGLLFGDDVLPVHFDNLGFRGPTACAAAGITYRQLDYWARTGLLEPSLRTAHGSESHRLYSFRDICVLKVIKRLMDAGVSLHPIRTLASALLDCAAADLARVFLLSNGKSIFECSPADTADLMADDQMIDISLGRIWREVDGTLMELPGESSRSD